MNWRKMVVVVTLAGLALGPSHPVVPEHDVQMPHVYQVDEYGCVPTSAAMVLATFGLRTNEAQLSVLMKTNRGHTGTYEAYAETALLNDEPSLRLISPTNSADLIRLLHREVGLHHSIMIATWMAQLPWYQTDPDKTVVHEIVLYGYTDAGQAVVWDPEPSSGGQYYISSEDLWRAVDHQDSIMVTR